MIEAERDAVIEQFCNDMAHVQSVANDCDHDGPCLYLQTALKENADLRRQLVECDMRRQAEKDGNEELEKRLAEKVHSAFCPECGSDNLKSMPNPSERGHRYCADCGQELFNLDYKAVIKANLGKAQNLKAQLEAEGE